MKQTKALRAKDSGDAGFGSYFNLETTRFSIKKW